MDKSEAEIQVEVVLAHRMQLKAREICRAERDELDRGELKAERNFKENSGAGGIIKAHLVNIGLSRGFRNSENYLINKNGRHLGRDAVCELGAYLSIEGWFCISLKIK